MRIEIDTIPHQEQRYPTPGDWEFIADSGRDVDLSITVSDMGDTDFEFLVAFHELIEAWLCRKRGVKEEDVTSFDKQFEAGREEGDDSEPGDDPAAPYHMEHAIATAFESQLASYLKVDWLEYEKAVNSL